MSPGRSLSISDFEKLHKNTQKKGTGREPILSFQSRREERRAACQRRCDGIVPAAESRSDRCENSVGGTLTLMGARGSSACWDVRMPGWEAKF